MHAELRTRNIQKNLPDILKTLLQDSEPFFKRRGRGVETRHIAHFLERLH